MLCGAGRLSCGSFRVSGALATRVALVVADLVVVVVTWAKQYRQAREVSALGMHVGPSTILLRDGKLSLSVSLCVHGHNCAFYRQRLLHVSRDTYNGGF